MHLIYVCSPTSCVSDAAMLCLKMQSSAKILLRSTFIFTSLPTKTLVLPAHHEKTCLFDPNMCIYYRAERIEACYEVGMNAFLQPPPVGEPCYLCLVLGVPLLAVGM